VILTASGQAYALYSTYTCLCIWVARTSQDKTNGDPIAKFANPIGGVCSLKLALYATHHYAMHMHYYANSYWCFKLMVEVYNLFVDVCES
jgi:hypothetical protein